MLKSAQVSTLEQLRLYFSRMVKRAGLHKKCQMVLLRETEYKRRRTAMEDRPGNSLGKYRLENQRRDTAFGSLKG